MRSFNSGREWWCALSPSVKEEMRFGVQSLASKEFVTRTDILIGPLTFGKPLPDILMSRFFSPIQISNSVLYTHLWQHLHTHHFHLLLSQTFSPKCITCCSQFSPCDSLKKLGVDYCEKWTIPVNVCSEPITRSFKGLCETFTPECQTWRTIM